MDAAEAAKEVLLKEGYLSGDRLIRDQALLIALSKIEQYKAECDYFEHKYGSVVGEFEAALRAEKGKEDFQQEEDLDDWEFANAALKWWTGKADELKSA
jgi:hypothetical protein